MEDPSSCYQKIAERYEALGDEYLRKMPDPSWAVVQLFYAGLHWLNSVFIKCGFMPDTANHYQRNQLLNNCPTGLEEISREYRELQSLSEQVRYHGKMFGTSHIQQYKSEFYLPIKDKAQEILHQPNFPSEEQKQKASQVLQRYR